MTLLRMRELEVLGNQSISGDTPIAGLELLDLIATIRLTDTRNQELARECRELMHNAKMAASHVRDSLKWLEDVAIGDDYHACAFPGCPAKLSPGTPIFCPIHES